MKKLGFRRTGNVWSHISCFEVLIFECLNFTQYNPIICQKFRISYDDFSFFSKFAAARSSPGVPEIKLLFFRPLGLKKRNRSE